MCPAAEIVPGGPILNRTTVTAEAPGPAPATPNDSTENLDADLRPITEAQPWPTREPGPMTSHDRKVSR